MGIQSILESPREKASQAAHNAKIVFSKQSKLPVLADRIVPIMWNEVREQSLLGKGAFSDVYRVEIAKPEFENKNCAIKFLSPKITNTCNGDFNLAAVDLAMEADLLSRLNHENIISLHGIYGGELKSAYTETRGNFLILDVLEDTLAKRLERCRIKERRKFSNSVSNSKLIDRIENIALGVAKGLEYLHNNGVIFRDLKPDNVGFNTEGKPVIFDFGFARELHLTQKDEIAGSLRYMSPEMSFGQSPSFSSDVYSFGVLFYEICTLQKPFKQFKSRADFQEQVLLGDYRPSLSPIHSKSIREVIASSWDSNREVRPDMTAIVNVLRVESALAERRGARLEKSRSMSFTGTTAPKRRNSLNNYKWDSIGKSGARNSTFFRRASFKVEQTSDHSTNKFDGEGSNSDLSLGEAPVLLQVPKRRPSGSFSRLSGSRSSFTSIGSMSSMGSFVSDAESTDSKAISEFTLGQMRKPFKRPSLIKFSIKS